MMKPGLKSEPEAVAAAGAASAGATSVATIRPVAATATAATTAVNRRRRVPILRGAREDPGRVERMSIPDLSDTSPSAAHGCARDGRKTK
ncbi:hypothetical protein GCM10009561_06480 [Frigoribacterium faeni]|nr:hypothetical protein GCM10025699_46550 [Microbacterium flavescens]